MKNRIRVMVVEDNPDYRDVISLALEDEADIQEKTVGRPVRQRQRQR